MAPAPWRVHRPSPAARAALLGLAIVAVAGGLAGARAAVADAASSSSAPAPAASTPAPVAAESDILGHLDTVTDWERQLLGLSAEAGEAPDTVFLEGARRRAAQLVQFAFEAADAQAAILAGRQASTSTPAAAASAAQVSRVGQAKALADARVTALRKQIADLVASIGTAPAERRLAVALQISRAQAALDFANAEVDALQSLISVLEANNSAVVGLSGRINALRQTIPDEVASASSTARAEVAKGGAVKTSAADGGLIGKGSVLSARLRELRAVDTALQRVKKLEKQVDALQAPVRDAARAAIAQVNQTAVNDDTSDPAALVAQRNDIEGRTRAFRQLVAVSLPLERETILLHQCREDLARWKLSVGRQYDLALRGVLIQVLVILAALALLTVGSEAWRRATFRYVHDLRRRRQLLVIRRVVSGVLMAIVVILGFFQEFSSLATVTGFLTAGVAVAFQTVLLSVAAYFFLIGRYGVKVGDRVTISGVTGDVIDIGLVRIYLLELAGTGVGVYNTGRIVVFSNSVLFQATPFFKQVPGTSYTWHEVAIPLKPEGGDQQAAEKRVLEAVTRIYSDYRPRLERQHQHLESFIETSFPMPEPQGLVQLTDAGLEYVVRYPVEIHSAGQVDDQVSREITAMLYSDPDFRNVVSGTPRIRSAIRN